MTPGKWGTEKQDRRPRSRRTRPVAGILLIFLGIACGTVPSAGHAETLKIGGTGGAMGAIRLLSEAFRKSHPGASFIFLEHMGSGGAIKAVLAGDLDIGISARPLSDEERRLDLKQVYYARTNFVVVAGGKRGVSGFTLGELADIYSGKRKSWPDGTSIRLVLRPESDTDIAMLKMMSPGMKQAVEYAMSRKGMIIAMTDSENADKLESVPGSLGTATMAQVLSENRKLEPMSLDGRDPAPKAIANPSYPYCKTFSIVSRSKPIGLAKEFVDFVLSDAGRNILVRTGHMALTVRRGR